jgi:hypothetical protein
MAKNSIRDYSATNSSNTDIQSIDISEGCSPAGINNAIREVMADLKDVSTGAVALESPAADSLTVTGAFTSQGIDDNATSTAMTLDSSGSVLMGGTSQNGTANRAAIFSANKFGLSVIDTTSFATNVGGALNLGGNYRTAGDAQAFCRVEALKENSTDGNFAYGMAFSTTPNGGTFTEAARIDSSQNLLVGTTSTTLTGNAGFTYQGGITTTSNNGSLSAIMNRNTNDGDIVQFRKDNTTVGSIGTGFGYLTIGSGVTGLLFDDVSSKSIRPWNLSTNTASDDDTDLGLSSQRFDDIYATNGTIQTSDANEKQQIAALTDAEMTAAKAISQLFKTFKWNSSVTENGDAARTHTGVIAQDVEAAMTAAGLDAGDYAFFISSTWWETQTDVPAVEAVDAVLDEDGNVVTEAVEAVAAYTRTDTYETAEEAPEGATERNRKGIRYPELLAFVGAATEQRLANIETRLAALEAN